MKTPLLLGLLTSVLTSLAHGQTGNAVSATSAGAVERFILGAENQAGPWGGNDGAGCGNELVRAAFAAAGDAVDLKVLPYVRAKTLTIEGELAGCFGMSWSAELTDQIVFAAKPLYQVQCVLLRRRGSPVKFQALGELPPKTVLGLVRDYEYPAGVRATATRGVLIEETNSEVQNLEKLAAGRIDAVVVNCDALKSLPLLLKEAGVEGEIESVSLVGVMDTFVGFSVRNPAGLRAREHFDRGMAIILANGTYDAIMQTWIRKSSPRETGREK